MVKRDVSAQHRKHGGAQPEVLEADLSPQLPVPLPAWALSPDAFDVPERTLTRAIRLWLEGPENWDLIRAQYGVFFEAQARSALAGLRGVIEALNIGARRDLLFHPLLSSKTTADERALVALLAALQVGDWDAARARARWLVGFPWQTLLLEEAWLLAGAFKARGLLFVPLTQRRNPVRGEAEAGDRETQPAAH